MTPCLCALTFLAILSPTSVDVREVYGQPLHCVQGKFHYSARDDSLVFHRALRNGEERVSIRLPHANIQGTFQVYYCWGQLTAIVGNEEVGVVFQWVEKGMA